LEDLDVDNVNNTIKMYLKSFETWTKSI